MNRRQMIGSMLGLAAGGRILKGQGGPRIPDSVEYKGLPLTWYGWHETPFMAELRGYWYAPSGYRDRRGGRIVFYSSHPGRATWCHEGDTMNASIHHGQIKVFIDTPDPVREAARLQCLTAMCTAIRYGLPGLGDPAFEFEKREIDLKPSPEPLTPELDKYLERLNRELELGKYETW